MCEDEVPDGVCALDVVWVVVEGLQEPGVLCCDEVSRFLICPELELSIVRELFEQWESREERRTMYS